MTDGVIDLYLNRSGFFEAWNVEGTRFYAVEVKIRRHDGIQTVSRQSSSVKTGYFGDIFRGPIRSGNKW